MTRRRVITGILLLVGGVLVNVAVAWACALASEYERGSDMARANRDDGSEDSIKYWRASVGSGGYYSAHWDLSTVSFVFNVGGPDELRSILAWCDLPRPPGIRKKPDSDWLTFERHGWPKQSLWCEYEWHEMGAPIYVSAVGGTITPM